MKPRNKREREVTELSSKLPPISDEQKEWAKEHCFPHEAYKCAGWYWCSDCGEQWFMEGTEKDGYIECPYCHKKLKVVTSRKRKKQEIEYMTIVTISKGYQVLRHVYCERWARKKGTIQHPSERTGGFYFNELVQEWINAKGERTIIARAMTMDGRWSYNSDLSIKTEHSSYYGCYPKNYAIAGYIYPAVKILPELKKRGLSKKVLDKTTPSRIMTNLLQGNNDYELCIKTKQYSMMQFLSMTGTFQIKYKPSFNICNRNHYIIKDASMWDDYMDLLIYFNKDTHNAKFVCPKDLKKQHDILLARKEKKEKERREKERRERLAREAIERKEDMLAFYQLKSKFFGMQIKGSGIIIHPLESITQFYKEGNAMNHCVFSMKYYSKPDSLILSATNLKGERLETIEVNLKTFKVIQSRAICNGQSEKHDDIVGLVTKNMRLIRQRMAS